VVNELVNEVNACVNERSRFEIESRADSCPM